jgi:hypothetical protein
VVSQLSLHDTVCGAGVGVAWAWGVDGDAPTLPARLEKPRKMPATVHKPTRTAARLRALFRRRIVYPLFLFKPGRKHLRPPVINPIIPDNSAAG